MKDEIFDKVTIEKIVQKIKNDPSGKLAKNMQQLIDLCEESGINGFTLREISIIATTGWYLSQSPQLRQFFDQLLSMPPPPDDDVWN